MTMITHEKISLKARQLWQNRGCPSDHDTEIWLEAERELNAAPADKTSPGQDSAATDDAAPQLSPVQAKRKSIKATVKKDAARAPQYPRHTGTKPVPAETGKPLWPRPHSS